MTALRYPFDTAAPSFDRHRALPAGVAEAIRRAIHRAMAAVERSRLLDLGAGTGRIGWPFVAAGDDYVGVDLSLGMLREFAARGDIIDHATPLLIQADGQQLPFADASFDAVLLMQVIGAAQSWQEFLAEARRVLRPAGALVVGHAVAPPDGLDARMKQRLAALLSEMNVSSYHRGRRAEAQHWLEAAAASSTRIVAASWKSQRTPRRYLDRQITGARFSRLSEPTKNEALRRLAAWAEATFGSLDASFSEQHDFELRVYRFEQGGRSLNARQFASSMVMAAS